jgi:hypothetical protein
LLNGQLKLIGRFLVLRFVIKTARDLEDRVRDGRALRKAIDNCLVVYARTGKVAIELVDRCPQQVFSLGS